MSSTGRVLIVDDDPQIRKLLSRYFTAQGFAVDTASDGASMRRLADERAPDVVLLDVGLPDEDGFSLARKLRAGSDVGIIMLTDRSETVDRVVGLEVGADDYVPKPFELRELLARVRSLLRRLEASARHGNIAEAERSIASFGPWRLDTASHELHHREGAVVSLTPKEFELLSFLLARPRQAMSREAILDRLDPTHRGPYDRSVDVLVHQLRGKLEDDASEPKLIKTVRGAGYMVACEVDWCTE